MSGGSGRRPLAVRVEEVALHRAELRTRIPFRYGIAEMRDVPHVFVRAVVRTKHGVSEGIAADLLPPKWFTKDPARSVADEVAEMQAVVACACAGARGLEAESAFAWWRALEARQKVEAARRGWPPLLAGFGVSLLERAVIEAVARAEGTTFSRALRDGTLGFEPSAVHASLARRDAADTLPAPRTGDVFARHTVGLADALTEEDVEVEGRLDDGLPESLEAAIGRYGLRHFKIKIAGGGDLERLRRVLAVIDRCASGDWCFSLDGNESFRSGAAFRELWRDLENESWWAAAARRLLFVEQPWHRDVALSDDVATLSSDWPERPPLIIDESDAEATSLPRALASGYDGTSHKNCKGVFKGAANACLLAWRERERGAGARAGLLTGEDLSNVGPVALLQDLAVQAALGVSSVERNGHHYFRGLSFWPEATQKTMLEEHGDLYRKTDYGWPTLAVEQGRVSVRSVSAAPFGRSGGLDLSAFERVG
jgi:hypothetical protein